jgi:hypothetical protein
MSAMRLLLAAGVAFLLLSAVAGSSRAQVSLDWKRVADKLVERMALQPGERVLLVGRPGPFDSLIPELRSAIVRARAIDLGALSAGPEPFTNQATTSLVSAAAGRDRAGLAELFRDVDVAVMLPFANGTAYDAMQDVLRNGRGRTVHFHWAGAYDLNGTALQSAPGMDELYQHALLQTDYGALSTRQSEFERAARGNEVRVTTPGGTDLRFRIGNRPVTRQDGDASAKRAARARNLIDREIELPAGALRVAPLEETVEGTIAFPNSTWNGQPVQDLVLRFARGKVVEIRARQGKEAVEAELSAGGEAARTFREFALGLNPLLAIPTESPWIPYYGYGAGVVRLSLGDNTELGGPVGGGYVRWNFFPDATVRVGDNVWVKDGR